MTDTTVSETKPVMAAPPAPEAPAEIVPVPKASDEISAQGRLRAFEDEVLGKDATRINGGVERGVGSRFAAMTPHQHRVHAALERLIITESKLADASASAASAEIDHKAAETAHEAALAAADEEKDAAAK